MNRLPVLKDELAFLEKRLAQLENSPELARLAVEFKKQMDAIRQEIRTLEEDK